MSQLKGALHVQLQVLQTDEESQGPFAFQLLALAKLHLDPQVKPQQNKFLIQQMHLIPLSRCKLCNG